MFDTKSLQPSESFRWAQEGGPPALVCRPLEPLALHLMTTSAWELGQAATGNASRAWDEVAAAIGVPLVRVHQVHGVAVLVRRRADPPAAERAAADIIVSDDPDVAIAIQTADCVPILIADRRTGVVAAAHAGWRGLAKGVPRVTVDALAREFGSRPDDLVTAAGPSIGACCYEVGEEVRLRFEDAGWPRSLIDRWFVPRPQPTARNPSMPGLPDPRPGHSYFDSATAARDQLLSAGVPEKQIFVADLCTASHPGALCSYRRDGAAAAGRMAAAIRMRDARIT